jgi:hypothetical protein
MKLQYKKDYNSLTEIIFFSNVLMFPKISVHNKLKLICTKSKECRLLKYSVIKGHGGLSTLKNSHHIEIFLISFQFLETSLGDFFTRD